MSLTTRCPSCATTFKVVPDQLKVSDGWVRCGQCAEVFDANANLRPLAGAEPADTADMADMADMADTADSSALEIPEARSEPEPGSGPAARPASRLAREPEPAAVWLRRSPDARVVLNGETLERPAPPDDDLDALDEPRAEPYLTFDDDDGDVPSALLLQTADNDEPQQSLYSPAFVQPAPDAGTPEAEAQAEFGDAAATLRDMDFVRVSERRAFWQRPVVVAASLFVCLVLSAVLGLQALRTERDRLAAHLPGLRPLLVSLCVPLGCEVAPLRRIDAVVIDGSSFNKVRGELFQFDVEVRNTAAIALAMPALELTLTDTQDQPLVRRVLLPAELRAAPELGAGSAWSGSLPVALQPAVQADRVAGYRVLAFYP